MTEHRNKYIEVYVRLSSYWGFILTQTQLGILHFVNNRTFRYDKSAELIPLSHFLDGVVDKDGVAVCAPVGCRKRSLLQNLEILTEQYKLLIKVSRGRNKATKYGINYEQLVEKAMPIMPIGKKKSAKSRFPNAHNLVPKCTFTGSQMHRNKDDYNKHDNNKRPRKDSGAISLKDSIEAKVKSDRTRDSQKADEINFKLTKKTLDRAWRACMREFYDNSTPIVPPNYTNWLKVRSGISSVRLPEGVQIYDIMRWSVENWARIGRQYFHWLKDPMPNLPDPDIWCVLYKHFVKCYASNALKTFAESRKKPEASPVDSQELKKLQQENQELKKRMRGLVKSSRTRGARSTHTNESGSIDDLPDWGDRG